MSAYVFLANGFEEIEALATADILRRSGIDTVLVGLDQVVESSHGLSVNPDAVATSEHDFELLDVAASDILIFPGGMPGSSNLAACDLLMKLLRKHYSEGGMVAAICAAPALVLTPNVPLKGMEVTCYPGMEQPLKDAGAVFVDRDVCVSETPFGGTLITASGPAFSFDFGLNIVSQALSEEDAEETGEKMLIF